jgi:hypothetical protein
MIQLTTRTVSPPPSVPFHPSFLHLFPCHTPRASLVGGSDNALDPAYMEDWGTRGLAVDDCGVQEQVRQLSEV